MALSLFRRFYTSYVLLGLGGAYRRLGRSEKYLQEASDSARGQDEWSLDANGYEDLGLLHLDKEEQPARLLSLPRTKLKRPRFNALNLRLFCDAIEYIKASQVT